MKIAVIGSAGAIKNGTNNGTAIFGGGGSGNVVPKHPISILDALNTRFIDEKNIEITYASGVNKDNGKNKKNFIFIQKIIKLTITFCYEVYCS